MTMKNTTLVGYIRKTEDGMLKVSINVEAFADCLEFITSDGQRYVSLVINIQHIQRIISGERAVCTIGQLNKFALIDGE
jgi:hypothetical protein